MAWTRVKNTDVTTYTSSGITRMPPTFAIDAVAGRRSRSSARTPIARRCSAASHQGSPEAPCRIHLTPRRNNRADCLLTRGF